LSPYFTNFQKDILTKTPRPSDKRRKDNCLIYK